MHFRIFLFTALCLGSAASGAEQAPYDSSTISGLGARNIGSATMSGRISALAAIREPLVSAATIRVNTLSAPLTSLESSEIVAALRRPAAYPPLTEPPLRVLAPSPSAPRSNTTASTSSFASSSAADSPA